MNQHFITPHIPMQQDFDTMTKVLESQPVRIITEQQIIQATVQRELAKLVGLSPIEILTSASSELSGEIVEQVADQRLRNLPLAQLRLNPYRGTFQTEVQGASMKIIATGTVITHQKDDQQYTVPVRITLQVGSDIDSGVKLDLDRPMREEISE